MDRDEIEDVVHASLGRHLRVTCVLGLLFLAVGFILGHYVAAQHTRELADQWSRKAEAFQGRIEQMHTDLKEEFRQELAAVRQEAQQSVEEVAQAKPQNEDILSETRRLARATEDLRRSLITRCIEQTEREKVRLLNELQPYLDRKMTLKATEVSGAVSRLVDLQVQQLKALATEDFTATAQSPSSLQIKSEIAPVSGETNPTQPTTANPSLLPVPGEASAPETRESVSLAPLPAVSATRSPVAAEPAPSNPVKPFFTAPRKPQLFIPSRKTAAVPSTPEAVIR
jgi:hypothetical protein